MTRTEALEHLIALAGVPVERGTVQAGPVRTAYLAAGSGDPVVLVHGAAGGAVAWVTLIGALSRHFRVIAPDVVGYGESDKPSARYDRPYFVSWLRQFADALGLGRFNLIGNSQGAAIAAQFAADHPERVARLVLIDSAAFSLGSIPAAILLILLHTVPSAGLARTLASYQVVRPERADEAWMDYSVGVCRMPGGKRSLWQGRFASDLPLRPEALAKIACPTLVVWGERDRWFPRADGEKAQRLIPDSELRVIPDAGHMPFVDRPEAASEAIVSFLLGKPAE